MSVYADDGDCVDCVYRGGPVGYHDTDEGCLNCGCTRVVFWDDDRGDE